MAKYKFISVSIYKREIGVFIGSRRDFQDWTRQFYKEDGTYSGLVELIGDTPEGSDVASFWSNKDTGDGIIELRKLPQTPREIAQCAHEALHGVFRILDYVGVTYEQYGKNEAFTYLLEHLIFNLLTTSDYKTF